MKQRYFCPTCEGAGHILIELEVRDCRRCGEPFNVALGEVSNEVRRRLGARRPTAFFCSQPCLDAKKQRAFRGRRKTAV